MNRPLPKTIARWAAANPEKFEEGWVERDDFEPSVNGGWSIWVYLRKGWYGYERGSHIIHEPLVADVMLALKDAKVCDCSDCLGTI